MNDQLINFVRSALNSMRLKTCIYTFPLKLDASFDYGLRKAVYTGGALYETFLQEFSHDLETACHSHLLFQFTDHFGCEYVLLNLPGEETNSILMIGPFSYSSFTNNSILKICRKIHINDIHFDFMRHYYLSLPSINEKQSIEGILFTLAHELWGERILRMPHLTDLHVSLPPFVDSVASPTKQTLTYITEKYENEDHLMKSITNGDLEIIEKIRQNLDLSKVPQQFSNSLRDYKNDLLVLNTVCRKAAQYGSVHPIYLDTQASKLRMRIESAANLKELNTIYKDIPYKYCLLVRGYSLKDYSPTVAKVIMHVDFHLTADLTLQTVSDHFSLNKNYLSTLFKKEVGTGFTTYVNQKRIRNALYLLNTSQLPIQKIAEACGVRDLNYFSRIFRKQIGMSPSSYRQNLRQNTIS